MWPLRRQKHLCGETGKSCSKKENMIYWDKRAVLMPEQGFA